MIVLKIIFYVLIGIAGVAVLLLILMKILEHVGDWKARKAARNYCDERGLTFKRVEIFSNQYGLYFKDGDKNLYANFNYHLRGSVIVWNTGTPEEKSRAQPQTTTEI